MKKSKPKKSAARPQPVVCGYCAADIRPDDPDGKDETICGTTVHARCLDAHVDQCRECSA